MKTVINNNLGKFIVDNRDKKANWIDFTIEQTYHKITFQNYSQNLL